MGREQADRRTCVFCGRKPGKGEKDEEHVIPQWLIKNTGLPDRFAILGPAGPKKKLPYSSFVFPSCKECNGRYSALESQAKSVIESLVEGRGIGPDEALVLLDWADKIRVGIWLASTRVGDGSTHDIAPRFHISDRIGACDRILYLARAEEQGTGLSWWLASDPVFVFCPSFQFICINSIVLVSYSASFLACRAIGYPYPVLTPLGFNSTGQPLAEIEHIYEPSMPSISALPMVPPGFSIIAQGIPSSSLLPLEADLEARFRVFGVNPAIPSAPFLSADGMWGPTERFSLPITFETRKDMVVSAHEAIRRIRTLTVNQLPYPKPGEPFYDIHMVKNLEETGQGWTMFMGPEIKELAQVYLEALRDSSKLEAYRELLERASSAAMARLTSFMAMLTAGSED